MFDVLLGSSVESDGLGCGNLSTARLILEAGFLQTLDPAECILSTSCRDGT